jgi:predicted ester cyclase
MVSEQNKRLVRRALEEIYTHGDLERADELVHPNFVEHEPSHAEEPTGPESVKQTVRRLRSMFRELRFEVEDEIAEGDKVVQLVTMSGRHTGPLMGREPTNIDSPSFRAGATTPHQRPRGPGAGCEEAGSRGYSAVLLLDGRGAMRADIEGQLTLPGPMRLGVSTADSSVYAKGKARVDRRRLCVLVARRSGRTLGGIAGRRQLRSWREVSSVRRLVRSRRWPLHPAVRACRARCR